MGFFKEVEGEACVIIHKGTYRQCPVYTRDGYLYAKVAGGFVRLMSDGSTTRTHTRLETISIETLTSSSTGKLALEGTPGTKALAAPKAQLLISKEEEPEG